MSQFHSFGVDGVDLTGTDEGACQWTVEDVTGWFTGGEVRTSVAARSQQNGDWRGKAYRAGRVVTLRGKVYAPDATALEQASRRFSAVLASGGFGEFAGDSPAGILTAQVQLEDMPLFDALTDSAATWQLTVGSEDPLLYGPQTFASTTLAAADGGAGRVWPRAWPRDWGAPPGVTPGAANLPNAGTSSYHPRLRIDGAVSNPVVQMVETGAWVRFSGTVADGQWLDFDLGKRRVLINGQVSQRHRVTFGGDWLAVPVGGGTVTWSADSYNDNHKLSAWGYEGAWL